MPDTGPVRTPHVGDVVLYHENVRQGLWDPLQPVVLAAIVTSVLAEEHGPPTPRVRLTVFRPFDKPLWDITADFAEAPMPGYWSWPGTSR